MLLGIKIAAVKVRPMSLDTVLGDGIYIVEFWETYEGSMVERVEIEVVDGLLVLTIPDVVDGLRDLALSIYSCSC